MSNVRKYLQDASRNANREFSNFNGSQPAYNNFTGGSGQQPFFNADGQTAAMQPQAPQSQPYAVTISNSTGTAKTITIFNGWVYLYTGGAFDASGNFVPTDSGVTLSGALPNVSYQYTLIQSIQVPFAVGSTQLITTVNDAQVNQPMVVTSKDANGNTISKNIIWSTNPYQNQNGNIINNTQYRIDGTTGMQMTVLPNAVFTIWFYPMENVDPARPLVGAASNQQFGNPGLQPANTVVIPSAAGTTIVNRLRS